MRALGRPSGLRPQLLLALLLTSAVTLGAATVTLLSPLQSRLRDQSTDTLADAAQTARPALVGALRGHKVFADDPGPGESVQALSDALRRRTGARIVVYGSERFKVYDTEGVNALDDRSDVRVSLRARTTVRSVQGDTARVAVPLVRDDRMLFVLAARKPLTDVQDAVGAVRDALVVAAVVGLGAALLLGLAFSSALTRRLGRLRDVAMRITAQGPEAPVPRDSGRDEVGDLARSLGVMQGSLRRQEAARRAFVSTASHELRTPLTSLQGNLELLAEDLADSRVDRDDALRQIAAAQGQLQRLGHLATELLDLSRLDADVPLRSEPVELGELCRAVAAEFELRGRERGVRVDVVPPRGPVWGGGDPGAVARVARILLDNALRFSSAGERVTISAAYAGDTAAVAVSDEGPGVPPAERDLIFERFQRGTQTGGAGGFGLGLAIGRETAQRLAGSLVLAPQDEGDAGARFVLTLPIALPQGGARPADEPAGIAPPGAT